MTLPDASTINPAPNLDPRMQARHLYWQGWRISAISQALCIRANTVHSWKMRDNWNGGTAMQRVAAVTEARLIFLINRPQKSDADYKELRQLERLINGNEHAAIGRTMPDAEHSRDSNTKTATRALSARASNLANAGADSLANAGADSLANAGADSLASAGADSLASAGADSLASAGADSLASAGADSLAETSRGRGSDNTLGKALSVAAEHLSDQVEAVAEKITAVAWDKKGTADDGRGCATAPLPTGSGRHGRANHKGRTAKNKKETQNFFPPEAFTRVQEIFNDQLFPYQRLWRGAGKKHRFRNILKSRQIGATFFFAREAFIDALITGNNKIFLSASRAQAFQFKQYIIDLACQVDVEIKGDVINLPNSGANLYFLGTNSRTAQGRHGDLYVDEYFWIPDFTRLRTLAEPMAAQKKYRTTFFSTPSHESHEAFPFWTGAEYNNGRPLNEHLKLDVSPRALKSGRLDPDMQWRQIVTLNTAEEGGCNLFDREYLTHRYSPDAFRQLFGCEFIASGNDVFKFELLKKAAVDSWEEWTNVYRPLAPKPAGNIPVWVGYDPTDNSDAAGLVIAIAPQTKNDPFRIIEKRLLRGNDFREQADIIKSLLNVYNVRQIVIDITGIGSAVFQLVKEFFPLAIGQRFTAEYKAMLVYKAVDLFRAGRIQWDAGDKDLLTSFMGIRSQQNPGGRTVTYVSDRSAASGHCDLAWAAMMLFYLEPLDANARGVEIDF